MQGYGCVVNQHTVTAKVLVQLIPDLARAHVGVPDIRTYSVIPAGVAGTVYRIWGRGESAGLNSTYMYRLKKGRGS